MVNIRKLKSRIHEMGYTQFTLAKKIGIERVALSRRLNDTSGRYLTLLQTEMLIKILEIESPEEYFFCSEVAHTQHV